MLVLCVVLGAVLLGLWALMRGWGRAPRPPWNWTLAAPFCAAHRGGSGLHPENTLPAFEAAAERYACPFLELDVHATSDGIPVVIHDPTVDRTTEGSGDVRRLTFAELRKLNAAAKFHPAIEPGEPGRCSIPSLEEVLQHFPRCWVSIDIKQNDPPCEAAVVDVIRRTGMGARVIVSSENLGVQRRLRQAGPEFAAFATQIAAGVFWFAHLAGLARWVVPQAHILQIPERIGPFQVVTRRFVADAHGLGLPVVIWLVDRPEDMRRLLDLGVDGIMTDRPDLAQAVIREWTARAG
jgi:glycerophosphoryl diester phosphodiesterase